MTPSGLQTLLERERAQAIARFRLDDALGTHHGLSWSDFVLLHHLEGEPAGIPHDKLAGALGVLRSRLLLQARPLEKLGLISREGDASKRATKLSPAGRRLFREARETAAAACAELAVS